MQSNVQQRGLPKKIVPAGSVIIGKRIISFFLHEFRQFLASPSFFLYKSYIIWIDSSFFVNAIHKLCNYLSMWKLRCFLFNWLNHTLLTRKGSKHDPWFKDFFLLGTIASNYKSLAQLWLNGSDRFTSHDQMKDYICILSTPATVRNIKFEQWCSLN